MKNNWWDNAPCIGEDINIFFPKDGNYGVAREICRECSYKKECVEMDLNSAGEVPIFYGMFGGLTPQERLEIFMKRKKT